MGFPRVGPMFFVCCAGLSFGQSDPDYSHNPALIPTVKAYELSATEEASFVVDEALSPFWTAWDATEGSSLEKVEINGVDNFTWGEATTTIDDGKIAIKVCYGAAGIYMLYTATDDAWSGYTHWLDYANDACELFGCQLSAQDMYNNLTTNLPCNDVQPWHQMNSVYFQLQIRFGLQGLEPVESFSLNKWNPTATDIAVFGCGHNNILYDRDVTFEEGLAMGIKVDIIAQTDATVRSQEWLIPWGQWGSTNPPTIGQQAKGARLGMCFGYNDLDPATQATSTAMRWRKSDPYSNTDWNKPASFTATPPATPTAMDAWGDILFDVPLDDIVDSLPIPMVRHSVTGLLTGSAAVGTQYYTLDGKRLTSAAVLPGSAVVLRRATLSNGSVRYSRVPFSAVR